MRCILVRQKGKGLAADTLDGRLGNLKRKDGKINDNYSRIIFFPLH